MKRSKARLATLVSSLALALALFVAAAPVAAYALAVYLSTIHRLEANLWLQAAAMERAISAQPEYWDLNSDRLRASYEPYVAPGDYFQVLDKAGRTVFQGGPPRAWHMVLRARALHDFGRPVGRVEAGASVREEILTGIVIAGVSLCFAYLIAGPLRRVPLAALAKAQAALLERDRYQRALLDNFPFMVWLKDRHGRFLAVNAPCATHFSGKLAESLIGMTHADVAARGIADVALLGDPDLPLTAVQSELDIGADGRRWYEIYSSPVLQETGEVLGSIGYARDVSAKKSGEIELARHRHQLEALVGIRTVELAAARDVAEKASRAKSEFLASMSHELRTPLNAILGFSQLMGMNAAAPWSVREQAGEIEQAGRHLLALVNDLVDLARIEAGKLEFRIEPVALSNVLAESVLLVAPLARAQRISIETEPDVTLHVWSDYLRLRQVLINLLTNAIKYNRAGGSVALRCQRDGAAVRVSVSDSGMGIAAAQQARLYTAFDRLGKEAGPIEGSGIGLAFTRRIVEAMGGTIGFSSVEGQGSTFWVAFAQAAEAPTALAAPPALRPACAQGAVILYIEDNPVNLRLMRKIVEQRPGLRMSEALSAEAGLALARSLLPDLILLDINLPGMDGYAALERLKCDPLTAAIPVVALTANAMKGDTERGRAAGFSDYLVKPIIVAEVLALLDTTAFKRQDDASSLDHGARRQHGPAIV